MRKRKNREAGSKLTYNKYHGYKTKVPATEEVAYVEEAKRGRPKMNASDEDPGSEHIMMQMRKVITTRGMHPVQFNDGKKHPQKVMFEASCNTYIKMSDLDILMNVKNQAHTTIATLEKAYDNS
jgi:hypothetical protein